MADVARGRPIIDADTVEDFWALEDVSFEIHRGEVIGIVGLNGAGKTTLLKILSRITAPTRGRVRIRGRVASLLEVGTGFHPELTGSENIFLNGAILGMSRREIRTKFDEIVAFADVERFISTPVKRYSSGMYLRLAFAVAAHLDPEILIVDEVLAVGDAEFQRRCLGKMREIAGNQGRTVLFVSHNMPSVQQLCTSGLLLSGGRVAHRGSIETTIAAYMSSIQRASGQKVGARPDRQGNGRVRVVDVTLHDERGAPLAVAVCGEPLHLRIHYQSQFVGSEHLIDVAFNLRNNAGILLTCFGNVQAGASRLPLYSSGYLECVWPKVTVRGGSYISTIFVGVEGEVSDWVQNAFSLDIEDSDFFKSGNLVSRDQGDLVCDQQWRSVGA